MALTYNWNTQTTTQTDADSPTDTTLMEGIRQNLIYLKEIGTYGGIIDIRNSGAQSFTSGLADEVQFDTDAVDSNGEFNTGTYRWTPQVAGLYLCQVNLQWGASADQGTFNAWFTRNGTIHPNIWATMAERASGTTSQNHKVFGLIDVNGSTDYIAVVATQSQGVARSLNSNACRWIGYRVGYNDTL